MSKSRIIIILSAILVAIVLVSCSRIGNIPDTANAVLTFKYNDSNIEVSLSEKESKTIRSIFNGRNLYTDTPSCGFSEEVSIRFGDMVFCIACDNCAIIKYNDCYFSVSDNDREVINSIFEKYGGFFPCI